MTNKKNFCKFPFNELDYKKNYNKIDHFNQRKQSIFFSKLLTGCWVISESWTGVIPVHLSCRDWCSIGVVWTDEWVLTRMYPWMSAWCHGVSGCRVCHVEWHGVHGGCGCCGGGVVVVLCGCGVSSRNHGIHYVQVASSVRGRNLEKKQDSLSFSFRRILHERKRIKNPAVVMPLYLRSKCIWLFFFKIISVISIFYKKTYFNYNFTFNVLNVKSFFRLKAETELLLSKNWNQIYALKTTIEIEFF